MFEDFVRQNNLQSYRLKQLYQQYYKDNISSWDDLTTWPLELREKLKSEIPFSKLENFQEYIAKDKKTIKTLSFTKEGFPVETVLMKYPKRNTICVSCMSGCPAGCTFCATGQMGFNKNLDTQEIIDQVLYFKRRLSKEDEKITNIVYMGMGEPMLNLENVARSIDILTDPEKVALGKRRITVSTVGYVEQLDQFLSMDLGVKIALSLHAPNQELREKLMPTAAKNNPLDKLMEVLKDYQERSNKKITYEYILIKDINDSKRHAKELAELLRDQIVLVNLIRLNPSPLIPFEPSSMNKTHSFQTILNEEGINNTLRQSYGDEINAACGQLANIQKGAKGGD
ncbi:MAG: putative dual-specificity RNA methyltransferase RlmN [candidate division WS6 bacterium 36_33]|uniref:Putative dual-specificity RNA methyltransferase RlmN n=1 Tax=candidate division WS6 bacterium 36_33 TaxID=1641388 RepID=A0A101GYI2_9BACT|nr:MAG: putative dual-specificity RNA methyltransferase RlmN [candidate division WS6 bacterium 36_33]